MANERILVVDDEDTIRHVITRVLEMKGCEIRQAGSAEAAIPLLEDWKPEVALLDIIMPGKSGLQLLPEIKRLSRDTEILIMTSNASAETALQAMRLGAFDYIQKPLDLKDLWANVQRALEKRSLTLRDRKLLREYEAQNRKLSAVLPGDVDAAAMASSSVSETVRQYLDAVAEKLEVDRLSFMLVEPGSDHLWIVASRGLPEDLDLEKVRIRIGEGIAGSVAQTGEPFVSSEGADIPQRREGAANLSDSLISAPIALSVAIKSDQEVLGVINVTNRRSNKPFRPEEIAYLKGLAGQLAVAIDGVRRSERLKKAYESLKSTQDQLVFSERIKAIGQMAAGVAHDFNNALSVILARAQVIRMKLDRPDPDMEKVRADLGTIVKTALHGGEMIKRIQDYTRIRKDAPSQPVQINEIIREAMEISRPKWKDESKVKGSTIDIQLELSDVPAVMGNLYELTQVMGNLIFNAVEAMADGGTITFRTRHDEDSVIVEVQDTGHGMDEATCERLFDPFFTTKETGQGLGTAIVYGIVSRHKGTIDVESQVGEGTTFTVRLPHAAKVAKQDAPAVDTDEAFQSAKILLIDDDDTVRESFLDALNTAGHQVTEITEPDALAFVLDQGTFDLMITDLHMGETSGLDLARQARSRRPAMPVVLLSAWAVQESEETMKDSGVDYVLAKPCLVEDLLATVQKAMRTPVKA